MGLFGGKKQISVASTAYNMAGPEEDRADFLKTTVVSKVLARRNAQSLGDHITTTYLNGPGMKLKSFARWARVHGYNAVLGLQDSRLAVSAQINLNPELVADQIPVGAGEKAIVQTATIGSAEYTFWVDQRVAQTRPEFVNAAYESDFDEGTNTITITYPDATTDSFQPVDFNSNAIYLYAGYNIGTGEEVQPLVPGTEVTLDETDPWPPLTGWTEVSLVETPTTVVLNTTVHTLVEYSDNRPPNENIIVTPRDEVYDVIAGEWTKNEYKGRHPTEPNKFYSLTSWMYQNQTHKVVETQTVDVDTQVVNGVTVTTTTTTTTQNLELVRKVRIDTQETWLGGVGAANVFIYRYQSGNPALDALFNASDNFGTMFPFLPVRLNNQFLSPSHFPVEYDWTRRAYRRVMGESINKVIDTLADNPSLKDIDHAYVVFGVALNTKESASIRYIYELFQEIMLGQSMGSSGITDWAVLNQQAADSVAAFAAWSEAQNDPSNPLFGTDAPTVIPYPQPPTYALILRGKDTLNFNLEVSWSGIDEKTGSGKLKPDANPGDLWITKGGEFRFDQSIYNGGSLVPGTTIQHDGITIYWQVDKDSWRSLDVFGLRHRNFIYGGRSVDITAHEALDDPDDSGFIIPLHEEIYRRTPIVPRTQASTACMHMVLNSLTINKQKWYETTVFKIFIVIIVIIITIVTAYIAGPAGVGILGANATVGAALGFSGVAAVIVGAVANAIAAMILTQIISYASNAIFGPEIGAIVTVIASIIAMQVGTAYATGASIVGSLNSLMQPENLIRLTAAAGEGVATFMRAQTQETMAEAQAMLNQLQTELAAVEEKREEIFGSEARAFFDPMTLTNATYTPVTESPQTFLSRTLLTGTDIAEASHEMLANFVDLTINTNQPGVA